MLANYLTVMARNIRRHLGYVLINLSGLSIGLTCCLLIAVYIGGEPLVDSQHAKADQIYRVIREKQSGDQTQFLERTSVTLANKLIDGYPEVESVVRLHRWTRWVEVEGRDAINVRFCISDQHLLNVFDFPLLHGSKAVALANERTVVLTYSLAMRLFGESDVIGKTVIMNEGDYRVTGVLADLADASSIKFDILTASHGPHWKKRWVAWDNGVPKVVETFVQLKPNADPKRLEEKLPSIVDDGYWYAETSWARYHLQPLTRIHLYSKQDFGKGAESHGGEPQILGDIRSLYLFAILGLTILTIACVNFINLATARAAGRAREVGRRKVVGAYRKQLIGQFLRESVAMAGVAFLLALGTTYLTLPSINQFVTRDLTRIDVGTLPLFLAGIVALVVGLIAGGYPAFILSAFDAATVLKCSHRATGQTRIRKTLVFLQFAIGILLLAGTWGIQSQRSWRFRCSVSQTETLP